MEIYLHLPFPPTINSYYFKGKIISSKGKLFREQVIKECFEQSVSKLALDCRLEVTTILYPPDRRVRDLDNYLKALQDALSHAELWVDDVQIDNGVQHRGVVVPGGACRVRIRPFEGMIMPYEEDIWEYID